MNEGYLSRLLLGKISANAYGGSSWALGPTFELLVIAKAKYLQLAISIKEAKANKSYFTDKSYKENTTPCKLTFYSLVLR